jgi:hypothetical protein
MVLNIKESILMILMDDFILMLIMVMALMKSLKMFKLIVTKIQFFLSIPVINVLNELKYLSEAIFDLLKKIGITYGELMIGCYIKKSKRCL